MVSAICNEVQIGHMYYNDKNNNRLHWSIYVQLYDRDDRPVQLSDPVQQTHITEGYKAHIVTKHGRVNGKIQTSIDVITCGKNIGKKNETNVLTQALQEALSKYTEKQRKESTDIVRPILLEDFTEKKIKYPCIC